MMKVWGSDSCAGCKQAVMLMQKYGIPFEYVDVSKTDFEGEIPRLVLENGKEIIGLSDINKYLQNKDFREPVFHG